MTQSKITDVEKFFIDNNPDMTVDELAKKLKKTKNQINAYIGHKQRKADKEAQEKVVEQQAPPEEKPMVSNPMLENAFARKQNAVVLTPGGSQMGDAARSKRKSIFDNPAVRKAKE